MSRQEGSNMGSLKVGFQADLSSPKTNQDKKRDFQAKFWKKPSTPPFDFQQHPSNFIVELWSSCRVYNKNDVESLIHGCGWISDSKFVYPFDNVAAKLYFCQWTDVLEVFVYFWDKCLDGSYFLKPHLISNLLVPSDEDEMNSRLKTLFSFWVKKLLGKVVERWTKKMVDASEELAKVQDLMRKGNKLVRYNELQEKKERITAEKDLILKRLVEFKAGMYCILSHLEGLQSKESVEVEVFRFHFEFNWKRLLSNATSC